MKKLLLLCAVLGSLFAAQDFSYLKENKKELTPEEKEFYLKNKDLVNESYKSLNQMPASKEQFLKDNGFNKDAFKDMVNAKKPKGFDD